MYTIRGSTSLGSWKKGVIGSGAKETSFILRKSNLPHANSSNLFLLSISFVPKNFIYLGFHFLGVNSDSIILPHNEKLLLCIHCIH